MSLLVELLERVKAATGADSSIDVALLHLWKPDHEALKIYDDRYETEFRDGGFSVWKKDGGYSASIPFPKFTASIDAALALTERVLPGWEQSHGELSWTHGFDGERIWSCNIRYYRSKEHGKTPPLAILAATLSAMIAKEAQ